MGWLCHASGLTEQRHASEDEQVESPPAIFISGVSRELGSARQIIANHLYFLSYQPVWQDIFGFEAGDCLEFHRGKIDLCVAVIQLVGRSYGKEPTNSQNEFGTVSYTQFEALYAKKKGKKVYYLLINDRYPKDAELEQSRELLERQKRYRDNILAQGDLYAEISSEDELKIAILKLGERRNEFEREWRHHAVHREKVLRRIQKMTELTLRLGRKNLGLAVILLGTVIVSMSIIVGMLVQIRTDLTEIPRKAEALQQVEAQQEGPQEVLATVMQELRKTGQGATTEAVVSAEVAASRELGISLEELRLQIGKLEGKANERLQLSSDLALLAAPRNGADYHEAEIRRKGRKIARDERIGALTDIAEIERLRIHFDRSSAYIEEAAQLIDPGTDPGRWARIQWIRADLAFDQGQLERSEELWKGILPYYINTAGPESKESLDVRNNIAVILGDLGRYQEAETEHRTILALEMEKWGKDDENTLTTRHNLAEVLRSQNRLNEAEQAYRSVIEDRTRVLGSDHPDTLTSRNNLGNVLRRQGKLDEAEIMHRATLAGREAALPAGHPQIIQSRNNLSVVLIHQGKLRDAENLLRTVLKDRENLLGSEHPETLMTCYNLAYCLEQDHRYEDALPLMRRAEDGRARVLGTDHPLTIQAREALERIEGSLLRK